MKKTIRSILVLTMLIGLNGCSDNRYSWQNNVRMIISVQQECERQTFKKFNKHPSNLGFDLDEYIQQGIKFKQPKNKEDKFMINCLKEIVNNNTPTDWFNKTYRQ